MNPSVNKPIIAPKYRFVALLLLIMPHILIYGGVQIISSFGQEIMSFLGVGEQQLSLLSALGTIAKATSAFAAGFVSAKIGGKKTIQIGLLIMALSGIMYLFLPKIFLLICVIRTIQGIGCGVSNTCLLSMVCSWFPKRERGIAQGLFSGLAGTSIAIASFYAQICADAGIVWYVGIGGLIACAGGLLIFVLQLFYRDVKEFYGVDNIDQIVIIEPTENQIKIHVKKPSSWNELFTRGDFWLIAVSALASGCATLSVGFIIPLFIVSCGFSAPEKTSIMCAGAITSLIMPVLSGLISKNCFHSRRCETVIIGYGGAGLLFLLFLITGGHLSVQMARIVFMAAFGAMYFGTGSFWTMTSEVSAPEFSSRFVGVSLMLSGFGGFAMTNILGMVIENVSMTAAMRTFCTCFFVVAVAIGIVMHKYRY